jgi:PleD family two-component response regulator
MTMVGKKILILDENEASRKFISNLLRQKQFEAFKASLPEEALIVVWHSEPDLILFDPVLSEILVENLLKKIYNNLCTDNTQLLH